MRFTTALGHTPTFQISANGNVVTGAMLDRVVSIRVESRDGGGEADVFDITLDDRDWNIASPSIGDGSATLAVAMGYAETGLYAMGTFQVDELYYEWPPKQLRLHGNSLGMTTNAKAPIIQAFASQTLSEIVGNIASAAGVTPRVDSSLASIQVPFLNQTCSPMHMLQELERTYNGMAKFSDGFLSFTPRGSGDAVSGQSIGTFTLVPEDFGPPGNSIKLTAQFAYSETRAMWFDPETYTTQTVTSAVPGSSSSSVPFLIKRVHPSQVEAQAAADSMMAQLNRKCGEGTIILAKGAPQVRGGQGFVIAGCKDGINGSWVVRRAVHTLAKQGGLTTVLDIYNAADDVDFGQQSTDGTLDFTGITATVLPADGIGHM